MINKFFTQIIKRARFFNGEEPSPEKLNGIQIQTEAAFDKVERALGNATDSGVTGVGIRNAAHNFAEIVGQTGNIYKPCNKVYKLNHITWTTTSDGIGIGFINEVTSTGNNITYLKIPNGKDVTLNIPVKVDEMLTFRYSCNEYGSKISIDERDITLPSNILPNKILDITEIKATKNNTGIKISASGDDFFLYSIGVISSTFANEENISPATIGNSSYPANQMYSIPFHSEQKLCKVGKACVKSIDMGNGICPDATIHGYCLGNTYDYDPHSITFGLPKCTSTYGGYETNSISGYSVVQTPLLTIDLPYTMKLAPIVPAYLYPPNTAPVIENKTVLYNKDNISNPILYNIRLNRPSLDYSNIFWIQDTGEISNDENGLKYNLVGGDYGLSNMIVDTMHITNGNL